MMQKLYHLVVWRFLPEILIMKKVMAQLGDSEVK